jgi:excisionase family DNA binding protein
VSGRLLTTREVAEWLGLAPETVLRRWRSGELPGFRLASNVLRFDRDEISDWLAAQRCGAPPPRGTVRLLSTGGDDAG